jgi:hypothetical protein
MKEVWQPEEIPDDARLYMRVHRNDIDNRGRPLPGAFRNSPPTPEGGMSTDWEKYSTPEATRQRGRQPEGNYAVIGLIAGRVRDIPNQRVQHTPVQDHTLHSDNRAHTDVLGLKNTEVRARYMLIFNLEIPLQS